jgi:hypothetical protein
MPQDTVDPTPDPEPIPDVADVLVDITALQGRLDHLAGDLTLALHADRQQLCRRLLAILGDGLDLLDDVASGRLT